MRVHGRKKISADNGKQKYCEQMGELHSAEFSGEWDGLEWERRE